MTGQVKEDILTRFGELGVVVRDSEIHFEPQLLNEKDGFLTGPKCFTYFDTDGQEQAIELNAGMLAFTLCQVPVIYVLSRYPKIVITKADRSKKESEDLKIDKEISSSIFRRQNGVRKIEVFIRMQ
jgi:hypothetical protein